MIVKIICIWYKEWILKLSKTRSYSINNKYILFSQSFFTSCTFIHTYIHVHHLCIFALYNICICSLYYVYSFYTTPELIFISYTYCFLSRFLCHTCLHICACSPILYIYYLEHMYSFFISCVSMLINCRIFV